MIRLVVTLAIAMLTAITASADVFPLRSLTSVNGSYPSISEGTFDLSSGQSLLWGRVDLTATPPPVANAWSHYYFFVDLNDGTHRLRTTMNTDWLGGWHGIPPQPWDRIRMETPPTGGPELYFSTQGGMRDDGGGYVYPSDRIYDFRVLLDPDAQTGALSAFAKGRGPDVKEWFDIGTMDLSGLGLDYSHLQLSGSLWSDGPSTTVRYQLGLAPVPEPASVFGLSTVVVLLGYRLRKRLS